MTTKCQADFIELMLSQEGTILNPIISNYIKELIETVEELERYKKVWIGLQNIVEGMVEDGINTSMEIPAFMKMVEDKNEEIQKFTRKTKDLRG